jgi:hypothetical protein
MWPGAQPNAISMNFNHANLTHDLKFIEEEEEEINNFERLEYHALPILC